MQMMPLLLSLHTVWSRLDDLEREQNARPRRSGLSPYSSDMRPTAGYFDLSVRMRCVRTALWISKERARGMLVERLSGINLSTIQGVLIAACEDVAVVWGGSILVGGALGGVIGAFGGGVGVVPGAAAGAGLGVQAGIWILGFLGLKSLIKDLGTAVPEVLRLYEQGFRTAWGKTDDWGAFQRQSGDDFVRTQDSARQFAEGHVLLMVTLLSALLAYLMRGRGGPVTKARIIQEIRESPRLGHKVADWVVANEEALARHPGLKPKEQQVMMSQAKPPAGPPTTPSQLRARSGQSDPSLPPPTATSAMQVSLQPIVPTSAAKLSAADFPPVGEQVSQKQLRHIRGRSEYRGGGYLDNVTDAQAVLDAYRAGSASVIGKSQQGFPIVRFDGVTGYNVNVRAGFSEQSTNVFMIKGTASPSVVPMNPNWTP